MNAGKIKSSSDYSVEFKQAAGLFECLMKHKVTSTEADFDWKGPRMSPETWDQILSFFQWTFKQNRSESQVRLFVHPEHGWLPWAFPQKGMGMTTVEIDNEEAKHQRATLIPPGYLAFGTVHHHCEMSAFQSGTDRRDEESVDGLHITVGDLGKEKLSLDARLYLKGNKFDPNLGAFFDIGPEHEPHLEWMGSVGYSTDEARNHIAKRILLTPVTDDTPFPALWKDNYIIPPPVIVQPHQNFQHHVVSGAQGKTLGKTNGVASTGGVGSMNGFVDEQAAGEVLDDLGVWVSKSKYSMAELYRAITDLGTDPDSEIKIEIVDMLAFSQITPEDLLDEMRRRERVVKSEITDHNQGQSLVGWDNYGG